jgi:hypothetical protein
MSRDIRAGMLAREPQDWQSVCISARSARRRQKHVSASLNARRLNAAVVAARSSLDRHKIAALPPQRLTNARASIAAKILGTRPELRLPTAAAQTRIVSVARIRPDSRKSVRSFKRIFCGDISEFGLTWPARQSGLYQLTCEAPVRPIYDDGLRRGGRRISRKNHYHQSSSPIVDSTALAASLAQHLTIILSTITAQRGAGRVDGDCGAGVAHGSSHRSRSKSAPRRSSLRRRA